MKVFLIGFMGSGKSYWGRIWAKSLGIIFFDLDVLIEKHENRSIDAVFEQQGEAYFRKLEAIAVRNFDDIPDAVIACGGGTPCYSDNLAWMNANGITIYLEASPELLYSRLLPEKEKRPLLKDIPGEELLGYIQEKLKKRESVYRQAKVIVPADGINAGSIVDILLKN